MRKLLETILQAEGYQILMAEDGREALKLAFENDFHAIIADEQMPGLTGSEMFKILNTDPEKRSVPRIMISGHAGEDKRPAPELYDVFVSKDNDIKTQLIAALDKLL